ncbi:TPT-domain-containing protein [Aspergillus sclerotioniger CBS 115572]|uniref:TPT-domain-containing protein n=1 Tax=Aspergillus sclerotioniger CBS 115572 TaxID=1450535 RepID=A0A317WNS0_9EURO|nr:TPT-domain-containing protein [Aspergillus sclerotioniger CBS 115572]PWY86578.1 TPT-domain-containing protein [Aspergillus sclerotioniger CBS 115572]
MILHSSPRGSLLQWLSSQFSRRRFQLTFILASTIAFFYLFRLNILPTDYEVPFKPRYARSLSARDLLARPLSQDLTTIPKIIHQTWFPAGTNMSEDAQAWVKTMRAHNPDWEYVLWDDETNRMLVEQYFPWFLTDYNRLPKEIHRADVVRNLYMYLFGGMYADVDTEALRPSEPLFTGHATTLAKHTQLLYSGPRKSQDSTQRGFVGHMAHKEGLDGPGAVPNGWMASPPGHPFWLLPVIHVIDNPNGNGDGSVEGLTGPGALGDMLHKSWVFWSNLTILYNKWVIESTDFPIILTTWHLIFATLATQFLARTTTLLDGRKKIRMDGRTYLRMIVPIGILYSGSLVCSNIVYLYLNVSFIQMLKACGPIITLLTSWTWHVTRPSVSSFLNILIIAFSVGLAVAGEVQFSWMGVFFQLASLVFDANRLVMIQILVSDDGGGGGGSLKMDPLVTLYYSAPVCAFTNFMIAFYTELRAFRWGVVSETGVGVLVGNAVVGFMLNVSIFVLIGKTSGLTMTLVSVPKNILLIVCSVVIWGTEISGLQIVGYAIALVGLLYYSLGWEVIRGLWEGGYGYMRVVGGRERERPEEKSEEPGEV